MKILLIQPPFTILRGEPRKCHPPLGLAYLAAALKGRHEVLILDALAEGYSCRQALGRGRLRYGLSFADIKIRIGQLRPDVVGVSNLFSAQHGLAAQVCAIVKEIDKNIAIVFGGAHPSSVPEEALNDPNIDFVVIGEGETAFAELLDAIEAKKDAGDIEGVGLRFHGRPKLNRRKNYQDDLDKISFPDWDIFPLDKYFEINNPHGSPARKIPFLPMITSRGCPFECIFCSIHNLWGRKYRKRSASNVLAEIDYLTDKFGVKEIIFEDDNLTLDRERAGEIFGGIRRGHPGLCWSVPNGVAAQTLDSKLLRLMRESGCYSLSIGVESGDEYILKNIIKKPIELAQVQPVINTAKTLGMETTVFFVVGFPGETNAQLKNTFRFASGLGADNINFFFATPLPGTRLLDLCREKGLIGKNYDYSRLKSGRPSFNPGTISAGRLSLFVARQKLKIYFLYLFRHPGKFIYKLCRRLLRMEYTFAVKNLWTATAQVFRLKEP